MTITKEMMQEIQEFAERLQGKMTLETLQDIMDKEHERTKDMPCEGFKAAIESGTVIDYGSKQTAKEFLIDYMANHGQNYKMINPTHLSMDFNTLCSLVEEYANKKNNL